MKDKASLAVKYMREKYNCAQSVYGAYCDELNLSFEKALEESFCYGSGRMIVCGAVYSAHKVLERLHKEDLIEEFNKRFEKINGTIICKKMKDSKDKPNRRSCVVYAEDAARILEEILIEGETND